MSEHPFHTWGVFLDRAGSQVLLHLRDGKADICPHTWALFGGLSEPGETPTQCFLREILEELGVRLSPGEVELVRSRPHHRTGQPAYLFLVDRYIAPRDLVLTEGAGFGWFPLNNVDGLALADDALEELSYLRERIESDDRVAAPRGWPQPLDVELPTRRTKTQTGDG